MSKVRSLLFIRIFDYDILVIFLNESYNNILKRPADGTFIDLKVCLCMIIWMDKANYEIFPRIDDGINDGRLHS